MVKLILIIFIGVNLFANEQDLIKCYNQGGIICGEELALFYRETKPDKAAEIFLDLSLKGSNLALRELGLYYIYNKKECKKGIMLLLNSTAGKGDVEAYNEISKLFKNGKCLDKSIEKAEKYKKLYLKKKGK